MDGSFSGGILLGNLKNDGVGLAPYHHFDDTVPAALKAEVEEVRDGLISGAISAGG